MIKTDTVHNAEVGKVVLIKKDNQFLNRNISNFIEETHLVRSIVAMPGNNIKWGAILFCLEKVALATRKVLD